PQDRLPDKPRNLDHPGIGQELAQIGADRTGFRAIRRAEVDQQHTDFRRGHWGMLVRKAHSRLPIANGRLRSLWPVSANKALAMAGATGGTASSVTPPGASWLGISSMVISGALARVGRRRSLNPIAVGSPCSKS